MSEHFRVLAERAARAVGSYYAFILAAAVVLIWAATGPLFHYSDTWQLFINTGTTIVTFLMVFLIQNTQNRDTEALQIKLDELIRATESANNTLLALEELGDGALEKQRKRFADLAREAREASKRDGCRAEDAQPDD